MVDFKISPTPSLPGNSHFAVGVNTGSLFLMIGPDHGRVIVGKGVLAGRVGQLHQAQLHLFRYIPTGSTITITV